MLENSYNNAKKEGGKEEKGNKEGKRKGEGGREDPPLLPFISFCVLLYTLSNTFWSTFLNYFFLILNSMQSCSFLMSVIIDAGSHLLETFPVEMITSFCPNPSLIFFETPSHFHS